MVSCLPTYLPAHIAILFYSIFVSTLYLNFHISNNPRVQSFQLTTTQMRFPTLLTVLALTLGINADSCPGGGDPNAANHPYTLCMNGCVEDWVSRGYGRTDDVVANSCAQKCEHLGGMNVKPDPAGENLIHAYYNVDTGEFRGNENMRPVAPPRPRRWGFW